MWKARNVIVPPYNSNENNKQAFASSYVTSTTETHKLMVYTAHDRFYGCPLHLIKARRLFRARNVTGI